MDIHNREARSIDVKACVSDLWYNILSCSSTGIVSDELSAGKLNCSLWGTFYIQDEQGLVVFICPSVTMLLLTVPSAGCKLMILVLYCNIVARHMTKLLPRFRKILEFNFRENPHGKFPCKNWSKQSYFCHHAIYIMGILPASSIDALSWNRHQQN